MKSPSTSKPVTKSQPKHLQIKALDGKKTKEKPMCSVEEDSKEDL
jgi:hypothetical protein